MPKTNNKLYLDPNPFAKTISFSLAAGGCIVTRFHNSINIVCCELGISKDSPDRSTNKSTSFVQLDELVRVSVQHLF